DRVAKPVGVAVDIEEVGQDVAEDAAGDGAAFGSRHMDDPTDSVIFIGSVEFAAVGQREGLCGVAHPTDGPTSGSRIERTGSDWPHILKHAGRAWLAQLV